MLHQGPCEPWPVDLTCCQGIPEDVDPGLVERWSTVASQILWRMSGRRWGPSCPITVRPCSRDCLESSGANVRWAAAGGTVGRWVPYIDHAGVWRNAAVCGCETDCHCGSELCEVRLDGPVYDILDVTVDGQELEPEAYRVDVPNLLVRTDGDCWPSCSDLLADCDQPGGFCVTYRVGLRLDEAAIAAVSELTCQLLAACGVADCRCQLPGSVQRVVRQGVTVDLVSEPTSIWREGRTGLPMVDAWLATVNPHSLTQPSRVLSPDMRRPRLTSWRPGA